MFKSRSAFLGLLVALALAVAVSAPVFAQKYGGTFRVAFMSDPPTLDPAHVTDTTSHSVVGTLFDTLLAFDKDLRPQPHVAESYSISPDGLVYTFKLRKGVRFHNGREATAEDFAYSFKRALDPATQSERTWVLDDIKGAEAFMKGEAKDVEGIKVLDKYTLQITLEKPFSPWINFMTYPTSAVVPREEVERWGKDFTEHPVGTGPFKFVSWSHDDKLVVEANKDYFLGRPYLDKIEYRIIPEESTRFLEYKAGNLDVTDIPVGQFKNVKADPVLSKELHHYPLMGTYSYRFNMEQEPFGGKDWNSEKKRKLRQALSYALDRVAIVDILLEGRHFPATGGVLPVGFPGYNPKLEGMYTYDLEKAKRLLAEAGYPDGKGLPTIQIYHNTSEAHRKVAEIVQANWKRLGIESEISSLDWAAYIKFVDDGGAKHVHRMGWIADYPDPENFISLLFHTKNIGPPGNSARYSNPEVDGLLDEADSSLDWEKRVKLYNKAEEIIMNDSPWICIYYYSTAILVKSYVKGLRLTPMDAGSEMGIQPKNILWLDK
ncbi:MAG: peptide ABC transporter substrate-binding protein [bacterium]